MTNERINIEHLHKASWKGLWNILSIRNTFRKWPFKVSLDFTVIFISYLGVIYWSKSFELLKSTSDLILTVFPNLLGFSLGGFAIVVGFSNVDLIKRGAKFDKPSLYQILNTIFAYNIIVQIIITAICFIVSWCNKIEISTLVIITNDKICGFVNLILLSIIVFGSLFTLFLIPLIVINLFSFSQTNSMYYTLQKESETSN